MLAKTSFPVPSLKKLYSIFYRYSIVFIICACKISFQEELLMLVMWGVQNTQ